MTVCGGDKELQPFRFHRTDGKQALGIILQVRFGIVAALQAMPQTGLEINDANMERNDRRFRYRRSVDDEDAGRRVGGQKPRTTEPIQSSDDYLVDQGISNEYLF